MEEKKEIEIQEVIENTEKGSPLLGAADDKFSVETHTLNVINDMVFPGNIAPEGYFYSPFYEVSLKELNDDVDFIIVKRVNFTPSDSTIDEIEEYVYDPATGSEEKKKLWLITIVSPVPYNVISYQPFTVYDISEESTYRAYLYGANGNVLTIAMDRPEIYDDAEPGYLAEIRRGLQGRVSGTKGQSRFIISLMEENVPDYAEFIPSSQKLVWRAPKKMSDLESTSPLYNMPFTNGRNYIHENVNVFVRRQDPHGEFHLFRPSEENPLRRFQIEGGEEIDFDYIQYITDTMIDAC